MIDPARIRFVNHVYKDGHRCHIGGFCMEVMDDAGVWVPIQHINVIAKTGEQISDEQLFGRAAA